MLIYHPAFDAYHCAFRAVAITNATSELELAKLRIVDFFLCFPAEVANIQLPVDHTKIRKIARTIKNDYRGPLNSVRTFTEMETIQMAATRMLAASGLFNPSKLEVGIVLRTSMPVPDRLLALQHAATMSSSSESAVRDYILNALSRIPLGGRDGLKQRTGLMEYRYDAA